MSTWFGPSGATGAFPIYLRERLPPRLAASLVAQRPGTSLALGETSSIYVASALRIAKVPSRGAEAGTTVLGRA